MTVFEQIRDSISVIDYLRNKGLDVKQVGGNYELKQCPFCGGHNCFRIFASGKRWSCFQCSDRKIGKDVLDLEFYFSNSSYKDSIKLLAESLGLEYEQDELSIIALEIKIIAVAYYSERLFDEGQIKERKLVFKKQAYAGTVLDYLIQLRKHSVETIRKFNLGMSDGRLFDYLVGNGFKLKEIRSSGLFKNDKDLFREGLVLYPHYVNGKPSHFTCKDPTAQMNPFQVEARFRDYNWKAYNQDCLLDNSQEEKNVILVEGENDLLSVSDKAGFETTVGLIGNISDEQLLWLTSLANSGWNLIMGFDGDEQGKKYRNLLIDRINKNLYDIPVSELGIDLNLDIDDILCSSENSQERLFKILENVDTDPKIYKVSKNEKKIQITEDKKETLPQSLPHERFLLRKIINGISLEEIFGLISTEEIFYLSLHKKIFLSLKNVYEQNMSLNALVAYSMFYDLKIITRDEDFDEIANEFLDSDIKSAVEILEKKWFRRQVISFGNELTKNGKDEKIEVKDFEELSTKKFFEVFSTTSNKNSELTVEALLDTNFAHEKTFKLVGTPFEDINNMITIGFDIGNNIVIAGRTGMGKSILKTNLKKYWCENGIGVLDFCPENRLKLEQDRLDSLLTGIEFSKIWRRKKGDPIDLKCNEAHKEISDKRWALWQNEELEKLTLSYIGLKVRQAQRERTDVKNWVVVVDLANKIKEYSLSRDTWKAIEVGNRKMKELSTSLGFCYVPIVQIGRDAEKDKKVANKRPELNDLKGSGSWEEDADMAILLFREKYYDDSLASDMLEINIAKQRGGKKSVFCKEFIPDITFIKDTEQINYEELPQVE